MVCFKSFSFIFPGFLLVYSITYRSSFEEIRKYHDQAFRIKDTDWLPMVLVGNKCDLEEDRQVTKEEGEELAKEWGIPFFETSAKYRINIEECFFELVRMVRDRSCELEIEGIKYRLSYIPRWKIFERRSMEKQLQQFH